MTRLDGRSRVWQTAHQRHVLVRAQRLPSDPPRRGSSRLGIALGILLLCLFAPLLALPQQITRDVTAPPGSCVFNGFAALHTVGGRHYQLR